MIVSSGHLGAAGVLPAHGEAGVSGLIAITAISCDRELVLLRTSVVAQGKKLNPVLVQLLFHRQMLAIGGHGHLAMEDIKSATSRAQVDQSNAALRHQKEELVIQTSE